MGATHNVSFAHADHDNRLRQDETRPAHRSSDGRPSDTNVELEPRIRNPLDERRQTCRNQPFECGVVPVDGEREVKLREPFVGSFLQRQIPRKRIS